MSLWRQLFYVEGIKRTSSRDLKNSSKLKNACGNDDGEVVFGKGWPLLTRDWDKDFFREEKIFD
jgi:hypothetical protein